jgi:hypothetical protein
MPKEILTGRASFDFASRFVIKNIDLMLVKDFHYFGVTVMGVGPYWLP